MHAALVSRGPVAGGSTTGSHQQDQGALQRHRQKCNRLGRAGNFLTLMLLHNFSVDWRYATLNHGSPVKHAVV